MNNFRIYFGWNYRKYADLTEGGQQMTRRDDIRLRGMSFGSLGFVSSF